ncbi:hypothetical protein AUP68_03372 [Ilyonectria robusta]
MTRRRMSQSHTVGGARRALRVARHGTTYGNVLLRHTLFVIRSLSAVVCHYPCRTNANAQATAGCPCFHSWGRRALDESGSNQRSPTATATSRLPSLALRLLDRLLRLSAHLSVNHVWVPVYVTQARGSHVSGKAYRSHILGSSAIHDSTTSRVSPLGAPVNSNKCLS